MRSVWCGCRFRPLNESSRSDPSRFPEIAAAIPQRRPGMPKQCSPCMCDTNRRVSWWCETEQCIIWTWVDSPQSNSHMSPCIRNAKDWRKRATHTLFLDMWEKWVTYGRNGLATYGEKGGVGDLFSCWFRVLDGAALDVPRNVISITSTSWPASERGREG